MLVVGALRWDALDWSEFVAELELFRDRFLGGGVSYQERDYLRCLRAFDGRSSAQRAVRVEYLLDFLNSWECRTNRALGGPLLADWIRVHADELDGFQGIRVESEALLSNSTS